MSPELQDLLMRATKARHKAYAPYSQFLVGAALRTVDGTVFEGCNVESAAYPATICAERTALVSAVVSGHRQFTELAVIGSGDGPTTPCGICRQMLYEFAPDLRVLAAGVDGSTKTFTLAEDLLPDGFGPARLGPSPRHASP